MKIRDGKIEPEVGDDSLKPTIPLRELCAAVSEYAFVSSPYPLFIFVDVQCGAEGQEQIATIMKDTLGEHLVQGSHNLPWSPAAAKGKIFLQASQSRNSNSGENQAGQITTGENARGASNANLLDKDESHNGRLGLLPALQALFAFPVRCGDSSFDLDTACRDIFSFTSADIHYAGPGSITPENTTSRLVSVSLDNQSTPRHQYWSAGAQMVAFQWQNFGMFHSRLSPRGSRVVQGGCGALTKRCLSVTDCMGTCSSPHHCATRRRGCHYELSMHSC